MDERHTELVESGGMKMPDVMGWTRVERGVWRKGRRYAALNKVQEGQTVGLRGYRCWGIRGQELGHPGMAGIGRYWIVVNGG